MAKANTVKSAFINHLGVIRGEFQGEGNLVVTTFSQGSKEFELSAPIVLIEDSDEYSETLSGFQKQRIQVEFATEVMDEWFNVSDIVVFIKPVASGYPLG